MNYFEQNKINFAREREEHNLQYPDEYVVRYIMKNFRNVSNNLKALDFACGSGRHTAFLASLGFEVTAIDYNKVCLDLTDEKVRSIPDAKVKCIQNSGYEVPCENNSYNLVLAWGAFMNCGADEAKTLLGNLAEKLVEGGKIFADFRTKEDSMYGKGEKIGEDYFYNFFVSVFQNYNQYLFNTEEETKKICKEITESNNYDNIPIDHLCKTGQFLKEFKVGDDQFLNTFFQTKIFKNFMIRKYLNNKIDKFIFLHFDEAILSKRNRSFFRRKVKTEFLESKILQATHSYGVDTTKNFSQEEYSYISENQDNLIYYNQRFNGIMFRYYLFPKLIYDNKYFKKLYMPPKFFDKFLYQQIKEYQKAIETLEQPKYFKIYDGTISSRHLHDTKNDLVNNEIKDDVILLWLRIFCLTFYYCETKEKIVRFVEMLQNLKKATHIKNDVLSLILTTIKKYGDEAMTINIFQKIKNFNYSQFAHMSNKLFSPNMAEVPPLKQLSIANAKLNINYFKDKEEAPKVFELNIKKFNLKHRTFWGEGMENKSEKIKFENPICPSCKKPNSLKTLMKSYDKMNKNKDLNCIHCKQLVTMSTKAILGDKIGGEEIVEIILYDPYYLYNNISTQLIKMYGNKIDLTDLRNNYKDFFWNCILNFKIAGLSCDMLLKYNKLYKVKIEEEKKEETDNKKGKKSKDKNKENKENKDNENKKRKFVDLKIVKIQ